MEGRYWRLDDEFAGATPPSSAEVLANYVAETERSRSTVWTGAA